MNTGSRLSRSTVLTALSILVFLTAKGFAVNFVLGSGVGYSAALTTTQYNVFDWGYTTPKLTLWLGGSTAIAFGQFSLALESYIQEYYDIDHWLTPTGTDSERFGPFAAVYLGAALEYRFFKDIRRTLNPYIGFGIYGLLYMDFFNSGPPEYPKTTGIKFAAGTRIRLTRVFFFNPRVVYFSGNSSLSLQAGLDLIL